MNIPNLKLIYTLLCDDGDACTSLDACNAGTCAGTPYNCDDSNVCTTDSCNGDGTCTNANNSNACDDGDVARPPALLQHHAALLGEPQPFVVDQ